MYITFPHSDTLRCHLGDQLIINITISIHLKDCLCSKIYKCHVCFLQSCPEKGSLLNVISIPFFLIYKPSWWKNLVHRCSELHWYTIFLVLKDHSIPGIKWPTWSWWNWFAVIFIYNDNYIFVSKTDFCFHTTLSGFGIGVILPL